MAFFKYNKAIISGITSCYPENVIKNISASPVLTEKEAEKIISVTGIRERRFASDNVCASDLSFQAAENLLNGLDIDRNSIDVLIFLSQTPDYLSVPATSCILQDRLGLSTETAAFDVALGCSGLVFALSTAYSYVESGANRVLLLVGETMSRFTSLQDKSTALLFGDGAAAILIENSKDRSDSYFSLRTNGSGADAIKIPSGGYRDPANSENIKVKRFDDGSLRSGLDVAMDGLKVFDFTMNEVVKNIKSVLSYAEVTIEDVDMFAFHQANMFMLDMFAKKLKIQKKRMPTSIEKYGNTSTVSIPLTITDAMQNRTNAIENTIMCGYGAGLSWGSALINLENCKYYDHIEYKLKL